MGFNLKRWLFAPVVFACVAACGQNMLKNGGLEGTDLGEFCPAGTAASYKYGIFTEDLTWNKCARMDLVEYVTGKEGNKCLNVGIVIGGAKGGDGQDGRKALDVAPNTTYKFSLSVKGTANKIGLSAFTWEGDCASYKDRKRAKTSLSSIKVQPEWTQYQGEFKTGPGDKKAALFAQAWCDEKQGGLTEKPGTYFMIDNVSVSEKQEDALRQDKASGEIRVEPKKVCEAPLLDKGPELDGRLDDAVWAKAGKVTNLLNLQGDAQAPTQSECMILAAPDAIYLGVKCDEPEVAKIKAACEKDGGPVFQDDCVEIFFDSRDDESMVRQFVVNANGARQMTWGQQPRQPGQENYAKWAAKAAKGQNCWTVEVKIPYESAGLKKRPEAGFSMPFNFCRERQVGKPELSSWSPVRGNFHRKEKYGVLAFGSLKEEALARIKTLREETSKIPADIPAEAAARRKTLEGKIDACEKNIAKAERVDAAAWEKAYLETEAARVEAARLKVSGMKFAVTRVSPTDDFTAPYSPSKINPELEKAGIEVKAAGGEFKSLPVAVSNLTDATEAYRVVLFGQEDDGIETEGLKGQGGDVFPASSIKMMEAVRVKDSDAATPGMKLDALPEMNRAGVITIPPNESGVVWVSLNTKGVKPGVYTGTLRVIPLSQPAKFELKNGWQYVGKMKDVPVRVEVLPFELPEEPPMPLWLMRSARNEKFFVDMIEHGNRVFQISPYDFKCAFDKDGAIKDKKKDGALKVLKKHMEWAKKHKVKIQFLVGFSCLDICMNVMGKKAFTLGSPEWAKAWKGWLGLVGEVFEDAGVDKKDYVLEIFDEPGNVDEVRVALSEAKKSFPDMRCTVTLGWPLWPADKIREIAPYVDELCIYDAYWNQPDVYNGVIDELRKKKCVLTYYCCHAGNLLIPSYQYYRLHMWKGLARKNEYVGLFTYLPGPGGHYGRASWKTNPEGGVIYNTCDEPTTSVRYECLREGMEDVRHMLLLSDLLEKNKAGISAGLRTKCEEFLREAPQNVVFNFPHKSELADEARLKAATLTIEVKKELGAIKK